jgi:acetate kinase
MISKFNYLNTKYSIIQYCCSINEDNQPVQVLVIKTDEELEIAIQANACAKSTDY